MHAQGPPWVIPFVAVSGGGVIGGDAVLGGLLDATVPPIALRRAGAVSGIHRAASSTTQVHSPSTSLRPTV